MNERSTAENGAPKLEALIPNPEAFAVEVGAVVHCSYSDRAIVVAKKDDHGQVWEAVETTHPAYQGPGHNRFIGNSYKEFQPAYVPCAAVTIISIHSKYPEIGRGNVTYTVKVPVIKSPIKPSVERTLSEAFSMTNRDDRPMGQQVCSTSSGDIMVLNDEHYLVERDGFRKLTLEQSEQIQKLTSRDTSFGYEFMKKHNIITA